MTEVSWVLKMEFGLKNLRSARASSLTVIGLKTGRGCAGHGGQQ